MAMDIELAPAGRSLEGNPVAEGGPRGFTGAILGVRELKAALRRRRRLWLSTAVVGLLIGAALPVALPRNYSADSKLYLVEPPNTTPSAAMDNEVSLLQTRTVARRAASYLPGHPSDQSVAAAYTGLAVSGSILSISAKAKSPADAVVLDRAVARAFLAVRSDELRRETAVVVAGLQAQIASLQSRSNPDQSHISQLRSSVLTAELNSGSSIDGSFVLDPAEVVRTSTKKAMVEDMLAGLVAGLGLGIGFVVIGEILSDRARRREDVAAELGVGVELSVTRFRSRPWARRKRRVEGHGSTATTIGRRLRAHLDAAPSRSLATFAVEAEQIAALALSSLAASLASEGRRVVLLDTAKSRPIASLCGLKAGAGPINRVDLHGYPVTVVIAPDDPAQGLEMLERPPSDDVLVLASVDPAFGVEHVAAWAREGVAIVRAGKATHTRLNGISRMIRQAGIALQSAILVDADPGDDTVGLLDFEAPSPEGRHTIDAISAREW